MPTTRSTPETRRLQGRIAAARRHHPDDPELEGWERELKVLQLEDHVRRVVESAPAPTPEQVERLRALLPAPTTRPAAAS